MSEAIVTGSSGINDVIKGTGSIDVFPVNLSLSGGKSQSYSFDKIYAFLGYVKINTNLACPYNYSSSGFTQSSGNLIGAGISPSPALFLPSRTITCIQADGTSSEPTTSSFTVLSVSSYKYTFSTPSYIYSAGNYGGSASKVSTGESAGLIFFS